MNNQPFHAVAVLAAVGQAVFADASDCRVNVGIGKNDAGSRTAQFHNGLDFLVSGRLIERPAGLATADKADHVDVLLDQTLTDPAVAVNFAKNSFGQNSRQNELNRFSA